MLSTDSSASRGTLPRHLQLWKMFNARSLAFIGGAGVTPAINYLRDLGFEGKVAVVNNVRAEVAGVPAVPSVADLPFVPDVAFVAVNRNTAIEVVRELAARGVNAIVCNSSGFAEVGEAGIPLQKKLVAAAGGSALIGPNCNGFVNYLGRVAAMVGHMGVRADKRGAALISQGGGFLVDMALSRRSLPISYIIGNGNQAMVTAADCIRAVLEDERVTAIGLYLEGSIDVERLSEAGAEALKKGVPVVVLKSGASEAGARAVLSHTASIAGANDMVEALFDRLGFIQTRSVSELLETLKFLTITGVPAGKRIGIVSSSGVESALAADAAHAAGLEIPQITLNERKELLVVLPDIANPNNPLDMTTGNWGNHDKQRKCCEAFIGFGYDTVVEVTTFPPDGTRPRLDWDISVDSFCDAIENAGGSGAIICSLAENLPQDVRERVIARKVTPLQDTQDGMRAVANAARYGLRRQAIQRDGFTSVLLPCPVSRQGTRDATLDEVSGKTALAAFGVPVPLGMIVLGGQSPFELGFPGPYAVKLLSAQVTHKTELGGVSLGAKDNAEVEAAIQAIQASVQAKAPHVDTGQFLVEQMVTDGVGEILVGVRCDPQLGLALVVGGGGQMVEVYQDRSLLLLPTTRRAVEATLAQLKIAKIFHGLRGKANGDFAATVNAILAVAAYAQHHSASLIDCEINPLIVRPEGQGVVAVDAVVVHAEI